MVFGSLSAHTRFVTPEQREKTRKKIENEDWARKQFKETKAEVDKYLAKVEKNEDWAVSRLAMNWDTHYEQVIIEDARAVGGKGRAPVPTPRMMGARSGGSYANTYKGPSLEEMRPYNDKDGKMWLENKETGEFEWAPWSQSDWFPKKINIKLLNLARDAGFLYWVTGEEKYAEFAAPILWVFMRGVAHMEPHPHNWTGLLSYRTIGASCPQRAAWAYIYLYDYIKQRENMDCDVIEKGFKKFADNQIAKGIGGGHNWNQIQAKTIAKCALALPESEASYYWDVILRAEEMEPKGESWRQTGFIEVIEDRYHPETALPPEHGGYGSGNIKKILQVAWMLPREKRAQVYNHPLLKRILFAQLQQTYPNGYFVGVGVTKVRQGQGRHRINASAAQTLLAHALREGEEKKAARLSALLHREMEAGAYELSKGQQHLRPSTSPPKPEKLPEPAPWTEVWQPPATFNAKPLNIVMMRNLTRDRKMEHAVVAAMYGSSGRQSHANGLAIELFGGGQILAEDPGIGHGNRHSKETKEYFMRAPAHNTVVINGGAVKGNRPMSVNRAYPAFDKDVKAAEANFVYTQGECSYNKPDARQQRTLALIRIDEETAFFFDVFRSELKGGSPDQYHDFFFHSRGGVELTSVSGDPLPLKKSQLLTAEKANMKAYDYFNNEKSITGDGKFRARWSGMDLFMTGGKDRRIFTVNSHTPTLVVRQHGEAWDRPFAAVYAPRSQNRGETVRNIETIRDNAWRVIGNGWSVKLTLKGDELEREISRGQKQKR